MKQGGEVWEIAACACHAPPRCHDLPSVCCGEFVVLDVWGTAECRPCPAISSVYKAGRHAVASNLSGCGHLGRLSG